MTMQHQYKASLKQIFPSPAITGQYYYQLSENITTVLGRETSCQIVLEATQYKGVSRRHVEIRPLYNAGITRWEICDLGSANGTFVNGQCLQGCQILQLGDSIKLGKNGPEFILESQQANLPKLNARPLNIQTSDSLHLSQVVPIFSNRKDLLSKAYLMPGLFTVLLVVSLFASIGIPVIFNGLLAVYLITAAYYFIYRLSGKSKPWWLLVGAAITTMIILVTPIVDLFIVFFRHVLPGSVDRESTNFIANLVHYFFGAGLMEELLKALPIFAALLLGRLFKSPWQERIGVWEPLDGILIGAASAAGFTILETLGQYVPGIVNDVTARAGEGAGELLGIQLLIPRIIASVAGHMAYSGYFGYFIGLSILKPSKRWKILAIGYLTASALHALWNASASIGDLVTVVAGILAYAFLMAAIVKARQISPSRSQNFATRFISHNP